MILEFEKNRLARESVEIKELLNEIMWKGVDHVSSKTSKSKPHMTILHRPESIKRAETASLAKYINLTRGDLMDYTERPKTTTLIPLHLYQHEALSGGSSIGSLSKSYTNLFYSDDNQSLKSTHEHLRKTTTSSVMGHSQDTAFRGYTPTGRKSNGEKGISSSDSVSNMSALTGDSVPSSTHHK